MIPTMILFGLVLGRWWKVALLASAIVWPLMLVIGMPSSGSPPEWTFILAAAALGALNAGVGVLVHQVILQITRWLLTDPVKKGT